MSALAAALACVLTVSACSSGHDAHGSMSSMSASAATASADDVMFAQMMIPHHQQAVVMADLAATRADSGQITALAAEIKAAQQPEIDQMSGWLAEWGAPVLSADDAMGSHGSHGMSGMLTDDQLDALAQASGASFDRLFAEAMIEHHQGAIEMADQVTGSADPRVASLAKQIISTQQAEITQLQAFLDGQAGSSG
ncbi:MAG: DUF305 domain-containing protein [Actinomycetales bacterium]|nr:DUF305 domain-containing protein [Actinomycetales bacterium]